MEGYKKVAASKTVEKLSGWSQSSMGAEGNVDRGHGVQALGGIFNCDKEKGSLNKVLFIDFWHFKRVYYYFPDNLSFWVYSPSLNQVRIN